MKPLLSTTPRNVRLTLLVTSILICFALIGAPAISSVERGSTGKSVNRAAKVAAASTNPRSKSLERLAANQDKSREESGGPIAVQAVGFAESVPVRDLPEVKVAREGFKFAVRDLEKEREEKNGQGSSGDKEAKEINETNREVIRPVDPKAPNTPDEALSSKTLGKAPKVPNPPTVSFEGTSIADTIAIGQGFLPPDTNGDVGPNHYVQTVSVTFRVWDKAGAPLTPTAALSSLFAPLGAPCGTSNDGDPIVLYDQLADRWLISQFCVVANPNNHQLIAISKTGDPTGSYYLYDFMMPNNKFNDYPHFGMWPDAYYMTDNQFNQAGTAFQGGGRFAFNRAKMLVGDPTAGFIYFDSCPTSTGCDIGGELPSDLDGLTLPPAGAPNVFASFTAGEFGDPQDGVRLFNFHVDFTTPANSTFTERTGSPLVVAAFDPVIVPNSRNVVPQPAPATAGSFLDAIADRLLFRLAYRNFGATESLIMNHTVNAAVNPAYRAAVRFYQLNHVTATPAAAYTIAEQQTFAGAGGDTSHRWMGSGAMNFQGDIALGYSVSSSTVFPSIRYAAKLFTDPAGGGLAQGEQTIIAGGGSQTSTSGRWGDYSDMTVDPSDDCSFWFTQEYYSVSSEPGNTTAPWHTRISKFAPGPCTTSPRGTISGTITNCQTGLPIPNAIVQITGGYSRATLANGTYSATVPPGTYDATATGTGYDTAMVNGLVVSNGGSATFSACLNGNLKQPVADTATVTADACNSNMVIDPNELVTVSFGIKNTGTLNTVSLVATLQATGGVTSPSGPQNYGVVVAGGATVFRSFTFTAGNVSCGSTLVATMDLQDGMTNLGTISYNFMTGVISASNYSTGNIAVVIPDNNLTGVDIPLTVADVMTLTDVNVSFRINHTFDGDLRISLVHPDNTVVPLVTNRGGSGANFGTGTNDCAGAGTGIDDQAATAITAGAAPFSGSFRPESPLSALNGKPSNGTWKLRLIDSAAIDIGTVGCVKLELNKRFVCCGALINSAPPPLITAENAVPANNAADPGETLTVNLPLVNVGGNNTTNLVATLQPTGGVTSPSGPQNYGVVVASGPAVARPFTFTAVGNCGDNITLTLALQDGATSLGTITYTMRLGTTVLGAPQTFSNTAVITIPAGAPTTTSGPANPYPSNVTVSGVVGTVAKVTVRLLQFNHTFPDDVDVLLVSPTGQKMIIMADTGGSPDAVNADITLDDAAASLLPDATVITTGTFRPTNIGTGDTFVAPAPVAPYLSAATAGTDTLNSAFAPQNPNGMWSLYVVDDVGGDVGNFNGGWAITFTTTSNVCSVVGGTCTSITCPANITSPNTAGQCAAVVNYTTPNPGGGCTVMCSPASGSSFPVGTTTVTCTGTGQILAPSGGSTCTFTVTVQDTQPPSITCPANITQSTDPNLCSAVVTYPPPTVGDNCAGVGTPVCSPASGSTFPKGVTTVTCTVGDASPNSPDATCTFTITVNDIQPPTITCPANITKSTDPNLCSAVVTYPPPTVGDNCPGVGTPVCNPASGSTFPKGVTTVTCTVADASPNSPDATCTFTITVNDTQQPTITCPANITKSTDPNLCSAVVTYPPPTVGDNCPGVGTPVCNPASGSTFPKGTTTVTCSVSDSVGNTSSCAFTITVNDTQPPTIMCPPNQTAVTNQNQCPSPPCAAVTYPAPVVTDNCPMVTFVCNPPSGSCFATGITTVTCTATDMSGNTATCSFFVTVFDTALQDDSDPSIILLWNSITGQYRFCCNGITFTGVGKSTIQGCVYTLQHNPVDRRVLGRVDKAVHAGSGSLQAPPGTTRCTITDRNTLNDMNLASCQ